MIDVAILAGGGGTRLWPLSRSGRPKQFLRIPHDRTLLEQAVERAGWITKSNRVWIVTIESQVTGTRKLLPDFDPNHIVAEPIGKNSAAAACAVTLAIEAAYNEPTTVFVQTADHWIPDRARFTKAIQTGLRRASDGESLITFGLKADLPRTDFGYVEAAKDSRAVHGVRKVARFIEKPPLAQARRFLKSGRHYWNSGMFAWRSDRFKKEMNRHAGKIVRPLNEVTWSSPNYADQLTACYKKLPNISIDYALMEKSKKVEVVPSNFQWSDLGTWDAVHAAMAKNKKANVIVGGGQVVEGSGNLVHADGRSIVVCGVDNLVVVETADQTLITTKENSKELKRYRAKLKI